MTGPQQRAEFLVAGAGPAGLTIARLLALKGRSVVVVDPCLHAAKRLELLAPVALATIEAIGLSPLLSNPAIARPCQGIRRWWRTRRCSSPRSGPAEGRRHSLGCQPPVAPL